jgi:DNA modification methylase
MKRTTAVKQADIFETAVPVVEAMETTPSSDPVPSTLKGGLAARNTLNDLSGEEWLPETKRFFFQKGLGASHPHASIERQHPAPFSFQDVQRLVAFFTKAGGIVLDPFSGVGSTAKACALSGRRAIGIELSERWNDLAKERLELEVAVGESDRHQLILGDTRAVLPTIPADSVDFVVTSPPYWAILNKKPDHKAIERVRQDLATTYSTDSRDLGNVGEYPAFLDEITSVFLACGRVLKPRGYMALVVSDFRHQSRFHAFHSDLIQGLDQAVIAPAHLLALQGVKVLLQNHKSLKPYGYPFAYVENIHHQYILIFRKEQQNK